MPHPCSPMSPLDRVNESGFKHRESSTCVNTPRKEPQCLSPSWLVHGSRRQDNRGTLTTPHTPQKHSEREPIHSFPLIQQISPNGRNQIRILNPVSRPGESPDPTSAQRSARHAAAQPHEARTPPPPPPPPCSAKRGPLGRSFAAPWSPRVQGR